MENIEEIAKAILIVSLLLLAGVLIRNRLNFLKRFYIPSSIVAGLLGVLLMGFIPENTREMIETIPKHLRIH